MFYHRIMFRANRALYFMCYKNHHHVFLRSRNLSFGSEVNGSASSEHEKINKCAKLYQNLYFNVFWLRNVTHLVVYIVSMVWEAKLNIESTSKDCT